MKDRTRVSSTVTHLVDRGLSERRAGVLVGLPRATRRDRPRPHADGDLLAALDAVTARHPRYGYRRAWAPRPGQVWGYDFLLDACLSVAKLRLLTGLDEFIRESVAIQLARAWPAPGPPRAWWWPLRNLPESLTGCVSRS